MARQYSAQTKSTLANTAAPEVPLYLLEITHSSMAAPARIVGDTQNITCNGNIFTAIQFDVTMPDDFESQAPKATLSISNAGKELIEPVETSGGLKGAKARLMQVMRSSPDVIEWEATMDFSSISINWQSVSGQLGFENLFSRQSIQMTYRPDTAPGVF